MTAEVEASAPLSLFRFKSLAGVSHAVSERWGGCSEPPFASLNLGLSVGDCRERVFENRSRFYRACGVRQSNVAVARLSHGNGVTVWKADDGGQPEWNRPEGANTEGAFLSDGMVSGVPGQHALFTFADCVPLAFWDSRLGVVGAAHAGWRGTSLGIAAQIVDAMRAAFGSRPQDLVCGIGPSIGPCCYTVGRDVPAAFLERGHRPEMVSRDGKLYLDLWESNRRQLVDAGLDDEAIEVSSICTSCTPDRFYSHRAQGGRTGRFGLLVGIHA